MTAVVPNPKNIRSFATEADFAKWLAKHHDRATELWIKIYKKNSGRKSITPAQALDVVLCYGWIDGLRKGFDEQAFLQRYSPRKPRSLWSQINRDNVARLIAAKRMSPHGQRQIDAAKADGRWDAAYAPIRSASAESIPTDLMKAIKAQPAAFKHFKTLDRMNLFALIFRTNNMKTPAGRAKKIVALVTMLARGETIVPQKAKVKAAAARTKPRA